MKNKYRYLCWIVDNYAVSLSVIFIWNLFEVVGKVHVGPLIINFLFVCFCFVLFCFNFCFDLFVCLFVCLFGFFFETDPIPSCLCVARVFASILYSAVLVIQWRKHLILWEHSNTNCYFMSKLCLLYCHYHNASWNYDCHSLFLLWDKVIVLLKTHMPITFSSSRAQPEVVHFLISNESPYFSGCKSKILALNSL